MFVVVGGIIPWKLYYTMDSRNCSSGLFTDSILIYNQATGKRPQRMMAWLAVSTVVLILHIINYMAFQIMVYARERYLARKETTTKLKKNQAHGRCLAEKRFPVVPFMSVCDTFFEILFVILVSCKVSSSRDGSAAFLTAYGRYFIKALVC